MKINFVMATFLLLCGSIYGQTVSPVAKLEAPGGLIFAMVCDGGESVVALAGQNDVYAWSLPSGDRRTLKTGLDGHVDPGAIACNRKMFAVGSTHGTVVVLDAGGAEQHRMELKEEVTFLTFSADGTMLAVTTANSPVQLWDVASGKALWKGSTDFGNSYGASIAPNGDLIVTADGDTHVRAYDRKGKFLYAADGGLLEPFDVSLSADAKTFTVAGAEGIIELHDAATGKLLKKSANSGNPIFLLAMAPQGRKVIGFVLDAYRMYPAAVAYWDPDSGGLKNLPLDAKTLLGIGRDDKSLLLVRQESPGRVVVERVD